MKGGNVRIFALLLMLLLPSIVYGGATATPTATAIFRNATTLQQLGSGPDNTLLYKGKQIVAGSGGGSVTTQNLTFAAGDNMEITGDDESKTLTFKTGSDYVVNVNCGGVDDTAAIAAAIAKASANISTSGGVRNAYATGPSGVVALHGFCVAAQVVLPTRVMIQGDDWRSTVLKQKDGADQHFITVADQVNTERVAVKNLYIHGNKSNQTGAWDCVRLDSTDSPWDRNHLVSENYITNCGGNAISLLGNWGEDRIQDNILALNDGYGIYATAWDSKFLNNSAWINKLGGINLTGAANALVADNKAWMNGQTNLGYGFVFYGDRITATNNDAQDNYGHGFYLRGNSMTVAGNMADRNGYQMNMDPSHIGAGYFVHALTNSSLNISASSFGTSSSTQSYGIIFDAAGSSGNDITLVSSGELLGDYTGIVPTNRFIVNGTEITEKVLSNGLAMNPLLAATSSNNYNAARITTASNWWNGSASQSSSWTLGPDITASGIPNFYQFTFTPNSYPSGTNPNVTLARLGTATAGSGNFNSTALQLSGNYWNGSSASGASWLMQAVLGSGTNPSNTLTLTGSGGGSTAINTNSPLTINTPSGFSGNELSLQSNGADVFRVSSTGPASVNTLNSLGNDTVLNLQQRSFATGMTRVLMDTGTISNTTGNSVGVSIEPTYNQASGSGSNTALRVKVKETAISSGAQRLISAGVDSAGAMVEKFGVDNAGHVLASGGSANHVICWKSDGKTLGYCSAAVSSDGTCGTCN